MSNLEMCIYTAFNGIETTGRWRDEREFEAVKNYLTEIGVRVTGIYENNKRKDGLFVYVETKEQADALTEFVKSLRQESNSAAP